MVGDRLRVLQQAVVLQVDSKATPGDAPPTSE
jgi:hypothetical protein